MPLQFYVIRECQISFDFTVIIKLNLNYLILLIKKALTSFGKKGKQTEFV
jgi:hypothetical protein